jgi:transketolase
MERMMTTLQSIRRQVVMTIAHAEGGHISANLSSVDILYTLFFRILNIDPNRPDWPDRDRFVVSKGHCAAALYTTMAARGFFPAERLKDYNVDGGAVPGIVDRFGLPGIEAAAGPIGRGLSIGIGMAIAGKRGEKKYRVYVLVGDGECQEGNIWEAVMLAPSLGLDNLTLVVDRNGLQASSAIHEIMDMSNLPGQLRAFGWETHEVDGHDPSELERAFLLPQRAPKAVIARTVKGKGVTMMENQVHWHGRSLTLKELVQAMRELR